MSKTASTQPANPANPAMQTTTGATPGSSSPVPNGSANYTPPTADDIYGQMASQGYTPAQVDYRRQQDAASAAGGGFWAQHDAVRSNPGIGSTPAGNDPGLTVGRMMTDPMQSGSDPSGLVAGRMMQGGMSPSGPLPGTPAIPYGNIQNFLNTSNVPGLASGDALRQAMLQQQQAAYQQATGYLDPQFANQEKSLQSQLTNQGIPQNSEAWNRAMDDFNRQKTFAYNQAEQGAVSQGNAAQNQLFGQGLAANQNQFGQNLSSGQFANSAQNQMAQQILAQMGLGTQYGIAQLGANTAQNQLNEEIAQHNFQNSMGMRQQDINELLMQQQNPLQMLNYLTSGGQVQSPNFTQTPGANIGNTDIASIINQYMQQGNNNYNAQVGATNSQNSGMSSILAAAILRMSDRRFKSNIVPIGIHRRAGVPVYSFDYVWGEPSIGVMADELEKVMPEAVHEIEGIKFVDYGKLI